MGVLLRLQIAFVQNKGVPQRTKLEVVGPLGFDIEGGSDTGTGSLHSVSRGQTLLIPTLNNSNLVKAVSTRTVFN